jgi:hypothetical protein
MECVYKGVEYNEGDKFKFVDVYRRESTIGILKYGLYLMVSDEDMSQAHLGWYVTYNWEDGTREICSLPEVFESHDAVKVK